MARSTLAALRTQVRLLINDPGSATFTDDQIDAQMDRRRRDFWHEQMLPIDRYVTGGTISYFDYRVICNRGAVENLESTAGGTSIFYLNNGTGGFVGTASYSLDEIRGLVSFTADQRGSVYYATGRTYDLYGVAADLLEALAAQKMLAFGFAEDGQTFSRQQQLDMVLKVAREYRTKSWPMAVASVRSDLGDTDPTTREHHWRTVGP